MKTIYQRGRLKIVSYYCLTTYSKYESIPFAYLSIRNYSIFLY